MRNICLVAPKVECLIYTVARAIASDDISVYVLTSPKNTNPYRSHAFYYERIERIKNTFIINEFQPINWEWIYFQIMSQLTQLDLKYIASHTRNIGIFSACRKSSYLRTLWHELQEAVKYFPVTSRSKCVLFHEGFYSLDFYSLIAPKKILGFEVHSNFLDDQFLNEKMFSFDWNPQQDRKFRLNFNVNGQNDWLSV